jgi:DNA-binding GntR family transcriptional regulator
LTDKPEPYELTPATTQGFADHTGIAIHTGAASLADRATNVLRNRILDLTLAPGAPLDERYLLENFDYGRTPMREALNRLIAEGLVETRGNRGMQVSPLNLSSTIQLLDAYVLCERMIASILYFDDKDLVTDLETLQGDYDAIAATGDILRVTEQNARFHYRLARATRNTFVRQYSSRLHNLARRLSYYIYQRESVISGGTADLFQAISEDHKQIIAAISTGNRGELVEKTTEHANLFRERLSRLVNSSQISGVDFLLERQ